MNALIHTPTSGNTIDFITPTTDPMRPIKVQCWKAEVSNLGVWDAGSIRFAMDLIIRTWLLRHPYLLDSIGGKL